MPVIDDNMVEDDSAFKLDETTINSDRTINKSFITDPKSISDRSISTSADFTLGETTINSDTTINRSFVVFDSILSVDKALTTNKVGCKLSGYKNENGDVKFYCRSERKGIGFLGLSAVKSCSEFSEFSGNIILDKTVKGICPFAFASKSSTKEVKQITLSGPVCCLGNVPKEVKIMDSLNKEVPHISECECPRAEFDWGTVIFHECGFLELNVKIDTLTKDMVEEALRGRENYSFIHVIIKGNVKHIGDNVFRNCKYLRIIKFPDTIETIGYGAFSNCCELRYFNIPNNIYEIEPKAFKNCSSLSQGLAAIIEGESALHITRIPLKNSQLPMIRLELQNYINGKVQVIPKLVEGKKASLTGHMLSGILQLYPKTINLILDSKVTSIAKDTFNVKGAEQIKEIEVEGNLDGVENIPAGVKLIYKKDVFENNYMGDTLNWDEAVSIIL